MNKAIGLLIYITVWFVLGYAAVVSLDASPFILLAGTIVHLLADFSEKLYGMVKS